MPDNTAFGQVRATRPSGAQAIGVDRLNHRQRDVLCLVCKGLRNVEVGQQLGLSERTVKGYLSQLFLIFDVTNRTELAGLVGDRGFGGPTSSD